MSGEATSVVPGRRVAIVHDYLTEMGGAERVVGKLLELLPEARLHTSSFAPGTVDGSFAERGVSTTFLDRLAAQKERSKRLFPLFPLAFRSMRLAPADVVLSSSSGFAHHVRPPAGALHLCYCYSPPRFLWQPDEYFRGRPALRASLSVVLAGMRAADVRASARVHAYAAVSRYTGSRIGATYGRPATVIYPPVEVERFRPSTERSGRFLVVSRLLAYKRIDLAVDAANSTGLLLDVIGDGPERAALEKRSGPTVRFLGRLTDAQVGHAMARCTALLMPGTEDFGMTAVEAQASGRPPIAFAAGGALESIADGVSGFLAHQASPESLSRQMLRASVTELGVEPLVASAARFSPAVFAVRLSAFLEAELERHRAGRPAPARYASAAAE